MHICDGYQLQPVSRLINISLFSLQPPESVGLSPHLAIGCYYLAISANSIYTSL